MDKNTREQEIEREAQPRHTSTDEHPGELNAMIVRPVLTYLGEHGAEGSVDQAAAAAGLRVEDITTHGAWLSTAQICAFLEAARKTMSSDREFARACVHDMFANYDVPINLLRAATPSMSFLLLCRMMPRASRVSTYTPSQVRRNSITLTYRTSRPDSRLLCLLRQAQMRTPLRLWGLPEAEVKERSCVVWGDDACVYQFNWQDDLRLHWAAIGGAVGALLGSMVPSSLVAPEFLVPGLVLAGVVAGLAVAYRRAFKVGLEFNHKTAATFEGLWEDYENARSELLNLQSEQEHWNQVLEGRLKERTEQLEAFIHGFGDLSPDQVQTLQAVSHDIRSPLAAIEAWVWLLRTQQPPPLEQALTDIEQALLDLNGSVAQLRQAGRDANAPFVQWREISVADLAARAGRRLRAFTLGRDIRHEVRCTQQAPPTIISDTMLLHRILDNILTNAAKYTERGSIQLEFSGSDDGLSLELSDTGRGMSTSRLEEILSGEVSPDVPEIGDSTGQGLAIMVRLLAELEGQLEVMSTAGVGTTLWLHLPLDGRAVARAKRREHTLEGTADIYERVVRIRPGAAAPMSAMAEQEREPKP